MKNPCGVQKLYVEGRMERVMPGIEVEFGGDMHWNQ